MAEKQLRLTACRVRITIPAMLRRAFLFFRAVLVVTTADWGFIYTPPPGHPVRTLASQPAAPWEPLPLPGRCLS